MTETLRDQLEWLLIETYGEKNGAAGFGAHDLRKIAENLACKEAELRGCLDAAMTDAKIENGRRHAIGQVEVVRLRGVFNGLVNSRFAVATQKEIAARLHYSEGHVTRLINGHGQIGIPAYENAIAAVERLTEIDHLKKTLLENERQIADLEEFKNSGESQIGALEQQRQEITQELAEVKTELSRRKARLGALEKQKPSGFRQKIQIGLALAGILFFFCAFAYKNAQYQLEKLWYASGSIKEEKQLMQRLDFIQDTASAFRDSLSKCVARLRQGYENFKTSAGVDTNIINFYYYKDPALKSWMKNSFTGFPIYGYSFYREMAMWNSFEVTNENTDPNPPKRLYCPLADYLTVPGRFQDKLKGPQVAPDSSLLKMAFHIRNDKFLPVLIFAVFISDTAQNGSPEKIMVRFPVYPVDTAGSGLSKNYILKTRQWYNDASDTARQALNFPAQSGSPGYTLGLSKPYVTIRDKMPGQRTLWVEIPLKDPAGKTKPRMIMGIDFLLDNRPTVADCWKALWQAQ